MKKLNDPRFPDHNWTCHSAGMKILFGMNPKAKWPREGLPPRQIEGIWLYVKALDPATSARRTHRVRAICPDCGTHLSAGRIAQHKCTLAKGARK